MTDRVRLKAGTVLGDAAALASKLTGKGTGASMRGQVLTRIYPKAFETLLKGRRNVAVTGTNGKTTTTHLLAAGLREALGDDAFRVATNADGANLHVGIASALAKSPRADIAVLETDERVVPAVLEKGTPEVLCMLNFSRDQLDRNHEIKFLARSWREALGRMGEAGPVVVANSDDPLITWAVEKARHVIWVDAPTTWVSDAALCPKCGALLSREDPNENSPQGNWDCPECDLTEHPASYLVRGDRIELPDGRLVDPDLNVPGQFNVANSAFALAAAVEMGADVDLTLRGFRNVTSPAGRFSTPTFGNTTVKLILSKNPAGWAESLPLATTETVILAIDAQAADGRDVSWLWDVEYEQLRGRHIIATGPRAHDLAVRLEYAEVDHVVHVDLMDAMRAAESAPQPVDMVTTYTPFQKLLKIAGLR